MSDPFTEGSIVMQFETTEPTEFIQFVPSHLKRDQWLHRREDFDPNASLSDIVEEYVLPEAKSYEVRIVKVPEGEKMQMGPMSPARDREGGADIVQLLSRDSIPDAWVHEVTPLEHWTANSP